MKASGKPSKQILVVDDEPSVCKAFKLLLNFEGHEVQSVDSGEAALGMLAQRPFDVVITDFSMPGIRGDELAARIKKLRPTQPVVMASAFAGEFEFIGQTAGQVDAMLVKPFSREALREAIDQALLRHAPGEGGLPFVVPPTSQAFIPTPES